MKKPDVSLESLLTALERELIGATDEEVLAAAAELGMNPSMKVSAAFVGIKSPLLVPRSRVGSASKERAKARTGRRPKGGAPRST